MHDDPRDHDDMIDDGADDLFIRRISRELKAPVPVAADFDARVMAAVRAAAADDAVEQRFASVQAAHAEHASSAATVAAVPAIAPASRQGALRRAAAWAARPRTLRVSPLAGLAVAAGLAFMFAIGRQSAGTGSAGPEGARQLATRPDSGAFLDSGAARDTGMLAAGVRTVAAGGAAEAPQMVAFVLVAPDARQVALVGDFNDWNAQATPLTPVRRGGVWTITVPLKPGRYNYNFVVDGTRWMPDPAAPAAPTDDFGTPASIVTVAGAQT